MKKVYRKIVKFYYKNEYYQMFYDNNNKEAFLIIDKFGKYHYPEWNKVMEIISLLHHNPNVAELKKDIEKFHFIPKVKYAGILAILSLSFLTSCGSDKTSVLPSKGGELLFDPNNYEVSNISSLSNGNIIEADDYSELFNSQNIENNLLNEELSVDDKYLELLSPADDEDDYLYASDFVYYEFVNQYYVRDSKGYEIIYGYSNVSIKDIENALNNSTSIPEKYKNFILDYVKDWTNKWPDSDFSTLYTNIINGLEIREVSKNEMMLITHSTDSVANYVKSENILNVLEGIQLTRESNDYIILTHELTHSLKNARYEKNDGTKINVGFFQNTNMGLYADEAIVTNLVYDLQGLDNKSIYYALQCNYYRIILDCIDYDGSDYINHSVNYLIDKMDEFMGDEKYAYHIVSLIDAEASLHYTDYLEVDFHEFQELHEYITRMYCKKYLNENMTYEETREVYKNLIEEITFYFDYLEEINRSYDIDFEVIDNTFEECVNDLGISETKIR